MASYENASVIILMTCAFSQAAENYNMNRLNQLIQTKKLESQIVVGGCLPSINGNRLREAFHGFVFSPRTIDSLNNLISTRVKIETIPPIVEEPEDGKRKAIRISTGCMGYCTYCAIPFANGRTRSRSIGDIKRDIQDAIEHGFRRIKIISEDLGAYGLDRNTSIIELLRAIISTDFDIELYLDNLNPNWLCHYGTELIDLLHSDRIAKKFSVPIQSGSDRVLKLMRRQHNIFEIRKILGDLYDAFPNVKICTDFMVGFPSETDFDFGETRLLLNAFPFHFLEIFTYEDRPETRASKLTPKIPEEVKEQRRQILFKDFLKQFLSSNSICNIEGLRRVMEDGNGLPVHFNFPNGVNGVSPQKEEDLLLNKGGDNCEDTGTEKEVRCGSRS
ncbi:MAG: radical SAM protein [Proteobacteria bacterium]|nr:radical SAM protein [Pseudomonadota bacterium]